MELHIGVVGHTLMQSRIKCAGQRSARTDMLLRMAARGDMHS